MTFRYPLFLAISAAALTFCSPGYAAQSAAQTRILVTGKIDETHLVSLPGNVRSEALNPANDRGPVSDSQPLDHMLLLLQRPAELQSAFDQYVQQQNQPGSPHYHRWLTAAQIGGQFGPSSQDLATVTGWLDSYGFTVNQVYPNRVIIDFSGTAAQIREAFHTEIHSLQVNGESHIANMSDPEIPAALAPVIAGIVSLNDFRPHPMHTPITTTHLSPKGGSLVTASQATTTGVNGNYTFTASGDSTRRWCPPIWRPSIT